MTPKPKFDFILEIDHVRDNFGLWLFVLITFGLYVMYQMISFFPFSLDMDTYLCDLFCNNLLLFFF